MTHLVSLKPLLFEPGDRMSREEFLNRWRKMPRVKYAELLDGCVYMPSPLAYEHGQRDTQIQTLPGTYAGRSRVCTAIGNATWLMLDSAPQPDVALSLLPEFGGTFTIDDEGLANGTPGLVVEVAKSTRSYDLGPKLALYERAGVPEYVAVVVERNEIQWRVLQAGRYTRIEPDADGVFRSRTFPGLWVHDEAFRSGDVARLLDVLDQGLQSPEFKAFSGRAAL